MISDLSRFRLDPGSGVGIAAQIRTRVAFLIADGKLSPGERLPSVRAFAGLLGVNVNTVREAYSRLETDHLVQTRHGVGTVVLPIGPPISAPGGRPLGTNTVGVIIGSLHPFYLPLLQGIEDVAREDGTLVLVADAHDSSAVAQSTIRRLVARGVGGIVAVSEGGFDEADAAAMSSTPIVYVDQPHRTGYVLLFDGRRAGYLATRHLCEHGHTRIGIVTPPRSWPNMREIKTGYVEALEEHGGDLSRELVSEVGGFTLEAGQIGLAQLLALPEPPTAVFAIDEMIALGALKEAHSRGVEVPGEIALVGFADSPVSMLLKPALTMVSAPAREIGMRAMRTLNELMSGRRPRPRRVVLDVELVIRESCGAHGVR